MNKPDNDTKYTLDKVRLDDIPYINRLFLDARVSKDSAATTGLVEYPALSYSDWEQRTKYPKYFDVLKHNGKVVAYSAAYDSRVLYKVFDSLHSAEILTEMKKVNIPEPYIYHDQIVIDLAYRNKGLATYITKKKLKEASRDGFCAFCSFIAHSPVRNEQSIRYSLGIGAKLFGEFTSINNLEFGIYGWLL